MTPYRSVLGPRFDDLAPALQAFHAGPGRFEGNITVERPTNPILRLMGTLGRFPPGGQHLLTVTKSEVGDAEDWRRDIGGHIMVSRQSVRSGLIEERLGPVTVRVALDHSADTLSMVLKSWRFLGLPLPLALAPGIVTREWTADGHYHFDVTIALPVTGHHLVRYFGALSIA